MIRQSSHYLLYILTLTVLTVMFSACVEPTNSTGANEFVVADVFATPGKSLATAELSPTPQPTPVPENMLPDTPAPTLPLPTVVVLEQPTLPILITGPSPTAIEAPAQSTLATLSCETAPPLPFGAIWQNVPQAQGAMRCPTGEPQSVHGVWQAFERGVMFWRENDNSIFIISETAIRQGQATDKWWRIVDTWQEGEPEDDPSLQPPEGMRQPVRGFGKAWRNNGFVREAVGWAIADELQIDSQWQTFEGGWMMTSPNGTPVYVMIPLDDPPYTNGSHLGPQG